MQQTANQVNKDITKLPKEKVWELMQNYADTIDNHYSLNKKTYLTVCILYGSFIETTYLACMAYEKKTNKRLKDVILYCNKMMVEYLFSSNTFFEDKPFYLNDNFKRKPFYYEDIITLKKLYDKVQIIDTKKVKLNSVGETVLEPVEAHVSDEDFKKIFELSKSIRQKYVTQ